MCFHPSFRLETLESRGLLAVTYYVSAAGNDAYAGTSPQSAWRSIARVNAVDLNPGDRILFEGGRTFGVNGAAGPNLIANPGFESGLKSWGDTMGAAAANATAGGASIHSGASALKISGAGVGVRAQEVTPSLRRNQAYTFSAWTRSTAVGTGDRRIGVTFYQSGKQVATFYRGFRCGSWAETQWALVEPVGFF
jgi:hypothetical protein